MADRQKAGESKETKHPARQEQSQASSEVAPQIEPQPVPADLDNLTPETILFFQQTQGNRFVQRLIGERHPLGGETSAFQRDLEERLARGRMRRHARESLEEGLEEDNSNLEDLINSMSEASLNTLGRESRLLRRMRERLSSEQFAFLAAAIMLNSSHASGARDEGRRVLQTQLGDPDVAMRMLGNRVQAVIVPRDQQMTALDEFESLRDQQTFDGRWWAHVRGSGDVQVGRNHYVAIIEENLQGGSPDPSVYDAVPGTEVPAEPELARGGYAEGYSTTTHEFAHGMHRYGLTRDDRQAITQAYNQRKTGTESPPELVQNLWVDGPRLSPHPPAAWGWTQEQWDSDIVALDPEARKRYECYASQNEEEYFAQLSNAYLGTNTGNEPTTSQPRNNGRAWIESNEPATILTLLDRLYQNQTVNEVEEGGALTPGGQRTNPAPPPPASEATPAAPETAGPETAETETEEAAGT